MRAGDLRALAANFEVDPMLGCVVLDVFGDPRRLQPQRTGEQRLDISTHVDPPSLRPPPMVM